MSLKKRFGNIAAAFLMVLSTIAPIGNGLLTKEAYAAVGDDAPAHSKNIKPNGDGTYELSLSVTGATQSSQTSEVTKANVILVLDTSNSMNSNYTTYNGSRMTRLNAEKHALTDDNGIIDNLLQQNVVGDQNKSDIIEVAIANFGTRGSTAQNFTTDKATLKSTINELTNSQGTNWEEGLMRAQELATSIKASQPAEDVYVIFMTDGEPTTHNNSYNVNLNYATEWGYASDNARSIVTSGYKLYGLFTWGSGTSSHYLSSLIQYAYTGSGNSSSSLDNQYAQYFKDATDTSALIEALNQIINDITNSVGYADVEFVDEVTEMTSTSISSAVDGTATGFKYTRSGGSYGEGQTWTDAPQVKIVDGKVDWDLGSLVLENGVTYTVSFTVWPSQESFDLVADLNNNKTSYDSLTDAQKSQIIKNGDKYFLKTNTDFPTISYSTITTTTVNGQSTTTKTEHEPINITNPDPVSLAEDKVTLEKLWEDSLDPSQREEICDENGSCEVVLDLNVDGKPYLTNIILSKANEWKINDYLAIAPGIMVSENSAAYDTKYPIVTIDGTKYAILETGHEYEFSEQDINNHFELTNYKYHPMLKDGELRNIRFTKDASGNITGVESDDPIMSSISATNTIKGGINIEKKVIDENGNEITESTDTFKVNVDLKNPDEDNTAYGYDYRIYYGSNNPKYSDCEDKTKCRSDHITGTGSFEETLYIGDVIRVVNVNNGTLFNVSEGDIPFGYELQGIDYQISQGSSSNPTDYTSSTTIDGKNYYAVLGNAAAYATLTNKYTSGNLKLSKTVNGNPSVAKEFDFKVVFKDDKGAELTGNYNYTLGDKKGTVTSGDTIKLSAGQEVEFLNLPAGATYEITETSLPGYTTTVNGVAGNVARGTISNTTEATAAFVNTYNLEKVSTSFVADKQFNDWTADDKFVFELRDKDGNYITEVTVDQDHKSATFNVEYSAPGEYTYTISEKALEDNARNQHINTTTSPNTLTVTVKVYDDGEGHLKLEGEPSFAGNQSTIINTYESTGSITIGAGKILTGRDWADGDAFTFDLYDLNGDEEKKIGTITLENGEIVNFDTAISYTTEDRDKTFYYVIREDESKNGHSAGLTNQNPNGVAITVTLSDDHQGNLTATINGTEGNTFTGTIENKYETKPTTATFDVQKTIEDLTNSKRDGEFEFQLIDKDGNVLQTKKITTNNLTGSVAFNAISYDKAGTYNYTIKEVKGSTAGFTYDETVHTVVVTVTDDIDKAQLSATVKVDGADKTTASFKNTYKAEPVTEELFEVSKKLTGLGNGVAAKDFVFELTGDATDSITINGAGTESFKALTYTKAGTYNYTITEKNTGESGYTYDKTVYTAVVTVEDVDGKLVATAVIKKGDSVVNSIEFANTYAATGSAKISVKKEFAGAARDWSNDSFTFTLEETDSILGEATASANTNWMATFDDIKYTEAGTYTYTIKESDSKLAGVSASAPVTVTVIVKDNGDGTLTAEVQNPASYVITNTYKTEETNVTLHVEKEIDDQSESSVDGTFTFVLKDSEGNEVDTKNVTTDGGKGGVDFKNITFDKAGEYHYTIVEKAGDQAGFSYDTKEYAVVVTVTDDPATAKLSAEVKIEGVTTNSATITNTYKAKPTSTQFEVEKVLTGMNEGIAAENFTFTLSGDGIEDQTITVVVNNEGKGTAKFDAINYEKTGEYHYTIVENNDNASGYVYDDSKYDVTVNVTDENGKLKATTIIKKNDEVKDSVVFENKYAAKGSISLKAVKALEGREWLDGETHSFVLKDSEGKVVDTQDITKEGEVSFKQIEYTKAGTYTYTIEEVLNEAYESLTADGIIKVTVTVTDDGKGNLTPSAKYDKNDTITNTYTATGSVNIEVTKAISGRDWLGTDEFFFELYDAEGNKVGETQSVTKDSDTTVFTIDTYTEADAGKTYTYTVKEVGDLPAGMEAPEPITITVSIVDNGDGTLTATPDQKDGYVITNTYVAEPTDVTLHVDKVIEDLSGSNVDGEFEFVLKNADGADEETITVATKDQKGGADFGELYFDEAGVYEYTIEEKDGGKSGFSYDTNAYKVVITVTDNTETAKLEAKVEIEGKETNSLTITNEYKAEPVTVIPSAYKVLTGMNEGVDPVDFSFTLSGKDIEDQTVTRNGEGSVEFNPIIIEKVGTYEYTVVEINDGAPGYTYDESVFTIVVDVTDDNGKLVAKITYKQDGEQTDGVIFRNEYSVEEITIVPEATKILLGRDQEKGEFTFKVFLDGELVATGYNDENGSVIFDNEISFSEVGTYKLVIKEIAGNDPEIEYDTTEYEYTLNVSDTGLGTLMIEYEGGAEDAIFVNKFIGGKGEEVPSNPRTYDDIATSIAILSASIIGLIAAAIFGKRQAKED